MRTVERVLREEGFPKLPRRARLRMKMTVKGAHIPEKSKTITAQDLEGQRLISSCAGIFLFAPFLAQFDLDPILQSAGLPGSQIIPAKSYLLSFLALKLLGTERYAHVGGHAFDPGLGAFAGLNVIPKCTALSTYSYSLDEVHLLRLQEAFIKQGNRLRLYEGKMINLDFHTLRRRGENLIHQIDQMTPWKRIHIPHPKRKFPNPLVHESLVSLRHYDDLVKSLKRRISVIPANPGSGPGQAPESRVPGENRDPVSRMAPGFRRDGVWTPVSTGVTTFYDSINV